MDDSFRLKLINMSLSLLARPPKNHGMIVSRSNLLLKILGSARELDENVLRHFIEGHEIEQVQELLAEVKAIVFSKGKLPSFQVF